MNNVKIIDQLILGFLKILCVSNLNAKKREMLPCCPSDPIGPTAKFAI